MSEERFQRVSELFVQAKGLGLHERDLFLVEACDGDDDLRREVEQLLNAASEPLPFAELADDLRGARRQISAATAKQQQSTITHERGTQVGPYKLLEKIGEGGFGLVYVAEQRQPVKRRVALKIIKLGMDTRQVIARFEAERQALAMMDHPNIAKVFDAGETDTGRPYFVMELVRGVPITEYCDTHNLDTTARLDLFASVCHAIQHAHQKGVIHRDIKPSNVMVTLHDGVPVPKVIDFGIAKATSAELTEKTIYTQHHQMIGTPAYMSPEQAEMSGLDIDTRSDIYSLGVLLYELLTGTTPFDPRRLRSAAYGEMQRIIREEEPHKPSTRVSALRVQGIEGSRDQGIKDGQAEPDALASGSSPSEPEAPARDSSAIASKTLAGASGSDSALPPPVPRSPIPDPSSAITIAKRRRTDPRSLSKQLRGDLDWIVMKCLEKDRTRRYETANGLAADIKRHLSDEPVVAGPPTAAYRLRKFVKRNRGQVIAGGVVAAALLLGIAGTTWGLVREQAARQAESQQRLVAEQARDAEVQQRQIAEEKTIEAQDNLKLAREQEQLANVSRDEAQKQKERAENAAHEARRLSYLASIRGAQASIQANDVRNARSLLDQAPSELRRWEWNYLHSQLDQSLAVLRGHDSGVTSVAFSPDGSRIASGGDKTVRVWDAASGDELTVLRGHENWVSSVAFSPDGSRIASGARDKTVRLWDASTGDELHVLHGHEGKVFSVAFSPDGSRIASASRSWLGDEDQKGSVRVWDAASGDELFVIRGHDSVVNSVAFSPDGARLASASADETVRLWDASTGNELLVIQGHEGGVWSVAFSPDGSRIAAAEPGGTVRLWNASTGDELLVLHGQGESVQKVAFSPDGTRIVIGFDDSTVRLWDAASGKELAVLRGHESAVYSVAFSPEGSRIASGSYDGTVRLWDASIPDDFAVLRGHEQWVLSVAFSPDGSRLASGSYDRTVRLWDASSGEELAVLRGHEGWSNSVAFSPDGSRIASGSYDRTVRLWDASTGEELLVLRGHEGSVRSVAFSPDGLRIASGSGFWLEGAGTVRLWDASTGEELLVLRGHESPVQSVAFSPDGSRIVSGAGLNSMGHESTDNTVRLWDASTGDELLVLVGHENMVISVAFSPDGSRIVSGSRDKTVRLWDSASGDELLILGGHQGDVDSVAFSPDGSRIASGSDDETVRVWDASSGDELLVLRTDQDVNSVAFSPDGSRIACAFNDYTVRLWDTIAYRDRVAERDDARRAEQTISPFVDQLFGQGLDCSAVADQVRTDVSLSEPLRHAAINVVLKRCSAIRKQAHSLIDDLEEHLIFAADIQAAVQQNTSLEPAVHAAAINIARWIGDTPSRLSLVASRIVDDDDRSPADYERARRAAASAFQSNPASWRSARTLAKAWTQLRKPHKAVEVWRERLDTLRAATPDDDLGLTGTWIEYAKALLKNDQAADAEPVLRECLSIREKALVNTELWFRNTEETRGLLGECLAAQGADRSLTVAARIEKLREAETILIELANATLDDDTSSEDDKAEAIQRVVDLYEAWHAAEPDEGYDARAEQWRARLPTKE